MYLPNDSLKQLEDLAKNIEENHRQLKNIVEATENTENGFLITAANSILVLKSIEDSIKYHQIWFEQQQKLLSDQMSMFYTDGS